MLKMKNQASTCASLGYGGAPLILGSVLALFSAWTETDTLKQKRD